jgi:hypothetical protein
MLDVTHWESDRDKPAAGWVQTVRVRPEIRAAEGPLLHGM